MAQTSSLLARFATERVASSPAPSRLEQDVVALFEQLRNPLLRYLRSLRIPPADGEEIVQETFLLLFRHLRAGKPRDNLQAWLFGVSHNLALKYYSRAGRENVESPGLSDRPDLAPNPAERLEMLELQQNLLVVVDALPAQDQRCLALRAEGLRYRDISRILGISLGSVANSLSRSLARLAHRAGAGKV